MGFHFWSRDLLRELQKKYEILLMVLFLLFGGVLASEALLFISFFWASFHSLSSSTLGVCPGEGFYLPDPCELTFANTLLLSNAAVSLGGAFVSLEISSQFYIFFALISFSLSSLFISLQIKEFRIMALSINDSLYGCLFFFLTGLHFFHLTVGLFLLSLFFWGCSFPYKISYFVNLRVLEVHLFYNLQLFYWHFLEILWLFIFLVFYVSSLSLSGFIILLTSIFTFFFFGEIRNLTTFTRLMDYNNGFSLSFFFNLFLSFLWIGAQFPQEKFLSYGRILTLDYYFLLMCILFHSFHYLSFAFPFIDTILKRDDSKQIMKENS